MAEIKKITLPSGNTYDIVDEGARELIKQMSGSTSMLGVTTTVLSDGATTNPISISGSNVQAFNGDMAIYNPDNDHSKEFVWVASVFSIWEKHQNASDKYYYTKIAIPTQQQAESAVYVRKTEAQMTATQTTPLDYQLGGEADYIKVEATGTANYGKWSEFGDFAELGELAFKDSVALVKDVNNVVGSGATVSVGNPTVSLTKADGSAGTGQVLLVDDVAVMGVTQPTISDGTTEKAKVLQWSGTDGPVKATVVKTVSATPTYFKKQTITGIGESTAASRIDNATQQKLIKDSFSFGVTNGTLIITAPGNDNTVTFATGGASATGTGANVVLGSQVSQVQNIPVAGTGVEVITTTTQASSTDAVAIVQAISSTNETNAVTVGGTLGSYAIKNQVASGGSVSLDVTKKVVRGSATQGTVTFDKDQKTVLSSDTSVSVS